MIDWNLALTIAAGVVLGFVGIWLLCTIIKTVFSVLDDLLYRRRVFNSWPW